MTKNSLCPITERKIALRNQISFDIIWKSDMMFLVCILLLLTERKDNYVQSADATIFTQPMTWNDANQVCNDMGQHLLTIDRVGKSRLIQNSYDMYNDFGVNEFWIGLHKPNSPLSDRYAWSDDCSSPTYENWSASKNDGGNNYCTYVVAKVMTWELAPCNSEKRAFVCEPVRSICNTGYYYEVFRNKAGLANKGQMLSDVSIETCEDNCNTIADNGFCWGFLYNPSDIRCRPYDIDDDPYYNDNNQLDDSKNLHVRRCNYTFSRVDDLMLVSNDSCGKEVDSKCSVFPCKETATPNLTTLIRSEESQTSSQTTEQPSTTSTELQSTTTTTELLSTKTTELPAIKTTELTSSNYETSNQQDISVTESVKQITTTGKENCKCVCQNVTKILSVEKSMQEIKDYLTVDKTKTSAYIRGHTSAIDDRLSSTSIGYCGIVVLATVFGLLMCTDIYNVYAFISKNKKRRIR